MAPVIYSVDQLRPNQETGRDPVIFSVDPGPCNCGVSVTQGDSLLYYCHMSFFDRIKSRRFKPSYLDVLCSAVRLDFAAWPISLYVMDADYFLMESNRIWKAAQVADVICGIIKFMNPKLPIYSISPIAVSRFAGCDGLSRTEKKKKTQEIIGRELGETVFSFDVCDSLMNAKYFRERVLNSNPRNPKDASSRASDNFPDARNKNKRGAIRYKLSQAPAIQRRGTDELEHALLPVPESGDEGGIREPPGGESLSADVPKFPELSGFSEPEDPGVWA